jgi:response regulator RpfG family c-di-GMP phosphodiesterase
MTTIGRPRILCVDDEPDVLEGLQDNLRRNFAVVTATTPNEGLERLKKEGPFAVVVADMRMPEMNGAAFLGVVRNEAPDAVRILLTGHADADAALAAVNKGQIFRYLTKPCSKETLLQALVAAVGEHRQLSAERALAEQAIRGAVAALEGLLRLIDPEAARRAERLRARAAELAEEVGASPAWHVEMAAVLSQVGCAALPVETAENYRHGNSLSEAEAILVDRLPDVADRLLQEVPRIGPISRILTSQNTNVSDDADIPLGSRIVRIAHDFDVLTSAGHPPDIALAYMRGRHGRYDAALLETFARLRVGDARRLAVKEIPLGEVELDMQFAEDARTPTGSTLVPRGKTVTPALLERLRTFPDPVRNQPVRVIVALGR